MNREEFDEFCERLLIAFPGIRDHVNEKSKRPKETVDTWFLTLSPFAISDADQVLLEWIQGTQEPPKAFDRDYMALRIRARILMIVSDRNKFRVADELRNDRRLAQQTRQAFHGLGIDTAYLLCRREIEKENSGEIDKETLRNKLREIVNCVG